MFYKYPPPPPLPHPIVHCLEEQMYSTCVYAKNYKSTEKGVVTRESYLEHLFPSLKIVRRLRHCIILSTYHTVVMLLDE